MKIELTVARVNFGGNSNGGEYFYSFNPDVVIVNKKNESIEYVLSDVTTSNFTINSVLTTDANNQFGAPVKSANERSVSVVDANTVAQLTVSSVLVFDKNTSQYISCDPQILNVPD